MAPALTPFKTKEKERPTFACTILASFEHPIMVLSHTKTCLYVLSTNIVQILNELELREVVGLELSSNVDGLQVFVRYNVRIKVKSVALDSFMTTIFTCIIMCIGSIMFSSDTDRIVILPITKMVGIIRMLADDPL